MFSTRKEALKAGDGKYSTGKPCRAGHVADRYTASGACVECVSLAAQTRMPVQSEARQAIREIRQRAADARRTEFQAQKAAYAAAQAALLEIRVRAFDSDLQTLRDLVVMLGVLRFPMLQSVEFIPTVRPVDHAGGTALYRFRCAVEDVPFIRETADVLLSQHRVDVSRVYDSVVRQAEHMAEQAATPPPEGHK